MFHLRNEKKQNITPNTTSVSKYGCIGEVKNIAI